MRRLTNGLLSFYFYLCALASGRPTGSDPDPAVDSKDAFTDVDGRADDPFYLKQFEGPKVKDVHMLLAGHRSHSSHASHASHRSGSSGGSSSGGYAPPPSRPVYVTPTTQPSPYRDTTPTSPQYTPQYAPPTTTRSTTQYAVTNQTGLMWPARDYYLRGMMSYRQDRFKEAEVDFRKATTLESGNPRYFHALGLAQYRNGDYAAALRSFEEADRLAEFEPDELKSKIREAIKAAKEALGPSP